jgi:hypothetical protein
MEDTLFFMSICILLFVIGIIGTVFVKDILFLDSFLIVADIILIVLFVNEVKNVTTRI